MLSSVISVCDRPRPVNQGADDRGLTAGSTHDLGPWFVPAHGEWGNHADGVVDAAVNVIKPGRQPCWRRFGG